MRMLLLLLAAISLALGADDDAWNKVKEVRSGAQVRIYRKGSTKPINATLIEASDGSLVYAIKKSQTSIDRKDVDRIDYRPPAKREKTETRTINADGTESASSGKSWSRGGWETVYQSPAH